MADKKPSAFDRLMVDMLERFMRSAVGKSPDELRALFDATLAGVNDASQAIVAIKVQLARIESHLGLAPGADLTDFVAAVAPGTNGRPGDGLARSATVCAALGSEPGGDGPQPGLSGNPPGGSGKQISGPGVVT